MCQDSRLEGQQLVLLSALLYGAGGNAFFSETKDKILSSRSESHNVNSDYHFKRSLSQLKPVVLASSEEIRQRSPSNYMKQSHP